MPVELTELNTDEILRYMGCPPDKAGAALWKLAEACGAEIQKTARPRYACGIFGICPEERGVLLEGGLLLPGQDLRGRLDGCRRAAVFCLTLGAEVDSLIRREQSRDMLRGLALDCAADAAVEQGCDQIEEGVKRGFPGCSFAARYSPGYGDLPLTVQEDLLRLLDAPRKVGLCATDRYLLAPRKSVTAILGISDGKRLHRGSERCGECPARDGCHYRKAGGHCGIS